MTQHNFDASFAASAPENYQRYFVPAIGRPLAEALVDAAELQPGERALDVGCGTGVVTRLAARRVGSAGRTAGLDINPGMLAVARAATGPELDIEWHEAGAAEMPLEDAAFDAVLCQMSLQFVPDREQALREMRRVLVPGGRLVLNVPGPAAPVFEVLAEGLGRHIAPQAAGFVKTVFALHDESELETLLGEAGFTGVETRVDSHDLRLPPPREFLWQYIGSTPLAAVVSEAGDAARAGLERDVVERWTDHARGEGMVCRQRVVTVTGRR